MFQLSRKKVFVIILIWLLLIALTVFGVIFLNNKKNISVSVNNSEKPYYNKREYYSFYDGNDLKIDKLYIDKDKYEDKYSYLKISGLRNSKIEDSINKILYNTVLENINDKISSINSYVNLNAFNILSISCYFNYLDDDMQIRKKYYNFDLTTGNEIRFNELFTNTANISGIIYDGVYNTLSTNISSEILYVDHEIRGAEIFIETGEGTQWYNENSNINELKEKRKKLVDKLNNVDDDAVVASRRISNNNNISFCLTSYGIKIDDEIGTILLSSKNNIKYFYYYEKYLTNNSIYKNNNIGLKNMFLTSSNNESLTYNRIQKVDDYALIDYEKFSDVNDDEISYLDSVINEYLNKIDKNKFSYLNVESFNSKDNSIISINGNLNLCTMSKDYYNNTYEKKLFDKKNELSYGAANMFYYDSDDKNMTCSSKDYSAIAINGKTYSKLDQIFVDDFDYETYLMKRYFEKRYLFYNDDIIEELRKKFKFDLNYGGIRLEFLNDDGLTNYETFEITSIPKEYLKIEL